MTRTSRATAVFVIFSVGVMFLSLAPAGAAPWCPSGSYPCERLWAVLPPVPTFGSGDFDGDGLTDLVLDDGSNTVFWFGAANHQLVAIPLTEIRVMVMDANLPRSVVGTEPLVGDFNADGRADVLWSPRSDTGTDSTSDNGQLWLSTTERGRFEGRRATPARHDPRAHPHVADFDGDGGDDVLWYRADTGWGLLQYVHPDGRVDNYPTTFDRGLQLEVGDFDSNSTGDLAWYNAATGRGAFWFFELGGAIGARVLQPGPGFRLASGRFDLDLADDLLWYGPGVLPDVLWYGTGDRGFRGSLLPQAVGGDFHPVIGDFDGDRYDDIYWWARGRQVDYIWLMRPGGVFGVQGTMGDAAGYRVADVDGDGADDVLWTGLAANGAASTWAVWWLTSAAR